MPSFADTRRGYANLWDGLVTRGDWSARAHGIAQGIIRDRERYDGVAEATGVPWWWVAIVHQMESSRDFATHLHNGDALTARTKRKPPGRPAAGSPPFTWEFSAVDALQIKGLHKLGAAAWTLERALYEWERYNGFGYFSRRVNINSPYLWSGSTHYVRGKYVVDGRYDAGHVSRQAGAAVILHALLEELHGDARGAAALEFLPRENMGRPVPAEEDDVADDDIQALVGVLRPFATIAPTIIDLLAGQDAWLAEKVLREALGLGTDDVGPAQIRREIVDTVDVVAISKKIRDAESILSEVLAKASGGVPGSAQAPVPANVEPGPIDRLFPKGLTGFKTVLGVGLFVALQVADLLGIGGVLVSDPVLEIGKWLAGSLAGVGLIAKVERWFDGLRGQPRQAMAYG